MPLIQFSLEESDLIKRYLLQTLGGGGGVEESFNQTILTLNDLLKEALNYIVGKGKIAGYQIFLLFPPSFLPFPFQVFQLNLFCGLQMPSI